eukprot:342564-Hanusia_phi.AAC.1
MISRPPRFAVQESQTCCQATSAEPLDAGCQSARQRRSAGHASRARGLCERPRPWTAGGAVERKRPWPEPAPGYKTAHNHVG